MGDGNFTIKEVFEWIVHVLGNKFLFPHHHNILQKTREIERERGGWKEEMEQMIMRTHTHRQISLIQIPPHSHMNNLHSFSARYETHVP